ncbi:MAG: PrsW family intramembrane metalloprotease [Anaerolineae bacterium]|nr:PrsW family intramembrane metalloprotease [Anaerolineae bacterium]
MFATLLILLMSFAPMLVYAVILWWLDRYEKEPLHLLIAAFLWGAVPSIFLAILLEVLFDVPLLAFQDNQLLYDLMGASVIAPVVEEGVKGIALLVLLLFVRHEINDPLDGIVYGGIVGFGFAAVENFLYLQGEFSLTGIEGVLGLAFLRAGLFGLNHAMYTGFTGLGIALSQEIRNTLGKFVSVGIGIMLAVAAHAFHNATTTFWGYSEEMGSVFLTIIGDWIGVVILLGVVVWSFFLERRRITRYAEALVKAQVIPQDEVFILKSVLLRNITRAKALFTLDLRRWWQLTRYYYKVTKAAFIWHRMRHGDKKLKDRLVHLQREFVDLRQRLGADAEKPVS